MSTNARLSAKRAKLASSADMQLRQQLQHVFPLTRLPTDIGATAFEFLRVAEMCALARACAPLRAFAKTALRRPRATLVCTLDRYQWVPMVFLERAAAACPRAARIRAISTVAGAQKRAFEAAPFLYGELARIARLACAPHLRELSLEVDDEQPLMQPQPRAFPRLEVVRLHIFDIRQFSRLLELAQDWEEHAACIEFHDLTRAAIELGPLVNACEPTAREARALRKVSRFDVSLELVAGTPVSECAAALVARLRLLPPQCPVCLCIWHADDSPVANGGPTELDRFAPLIIEGFSGRLHATQITPDWLLLSSENNLGAGCSDVEALRNRDTCT